LRSNLAPSDTLSFSKIVLSVFMIYCSTALADNKAALKDAIGFSVSVADAKPIKKVYNINLETDETFKAIEKEFENLDDDKNEKLTLIEAGKNQTLAKEFDIIDINHDRLLSVDEYIYYKTAVISSKNSYAITEGIATN